MIFSARHPLWLVGFRPFFGLTLIAGVLLPLAWVLIFSGYMPLPSVRITPFQWHAHEMFYGFGWALLGGFLLTASKNWVSVRGYHGAALMGLVIAWLLERIVLGIAGQLPTLLFWIGANLHLPAIVGMIMFTLIRHRAKDSFNDNYFFLMALPLFVVAKNLLLMPEYFALGAGMTLALFRLAFLVMFERTLTQFMKGVFQISLPRYRWLDGGIKTGALVLVAAPLMPAAIAASLDLFVALLLNIRFMLWKPQLGLRGIGTAVMYLGYLALAAQLVVDAIALTLHPVWIGNLSVHVFSFGVMGAIIPAMVVRISKGHTGRKVSFEIWDKIALWSMLLAFLARIVGPQLYADAYAGWLHIAACGWSIGFGILAWRYIPFYFRPRIDGREH